MAQLIDRDAIIAEVKKRLNTTGDTSQWLCGKLDAYREILNFLTAIEVKNMDLEKEVDIWYDKFATSNGFDWTGFAKHFYELGKCTW